MNVAAEFFVRTARMQLFALVAATRLRAAAERAGAGFAPVLVHARRAPGPAAAGELRLSQIGLANHQLTGKDSTFIDGDRFRGDVAIQHAGLVNIHGTGGDNFARHLSFDVDAADREPD